MSDTEHTSKVICNLVLRLVLAVHIVDELVECFSDSVHIDFIFHVNAFGKIICHVTVHILTRGDQVLLDARKRVVLFDLQVDDFVRDDSHTLQ